MTQRIDDFDEVRQILDSLEAQVTAALADDEADTELIASQQAQIDKLRSDAEWRENSRKSYIQAHNAAVKALGLPLPKPNGGGAYTPEEIIAAASARPDQSAEVARLLREEAEADALQTRLKDAITKAGIKL